MYKSPKHLQPTTFTFTKTFTDFAHDNYFELINTHSKLWIVVYTSKWFMVQWFSWITAEKKYVSTMQDQYIAFTMTTIIQIHKNFRR